MEIKTCYNFDLQNIPISFFAADVKKKINIITATLYTYVNIDISPKAAGVKLL